VETVPAKILNEIASSQKLKTEGAQRLFQMTDEEKDQDQADQYQALLEGRSPAAGGVELPGASPAYGGERGDQPLRGGEGRPGPTNAATGDLESPRSNADRGQASADGADSETGF
jgi:hypothetical protein